MVICVAFGGLRDGVMGGGRKKMKVPFSEGPKSK